MSTTRALEHAIQHVKNGSTVELTTDDVLSMWGLVRAARLDELDRENARMRAALERVRSELEMHINWKPTGVAVEVAIAFEIAREALAGSGEK
jgi:hypothetical protein